MKFKTIRPAAVAAIAFIVVHFLFVCPPLFAMTCREFYQEFIFRQLKQSEIEILTRFAYEPDVYRSSSEVTRQLMLSDQGKWEVLDAE